MISKTNSLDRSRVSELNINMSISKSTEEKRKTHHDILERNKCTHKHSSSYVSLLYHKECKHKSV